MARVIEPSLEEFEEFVRQLESEKAELGPKAKLGPKAELGPKELENSSCAGFCNEYSCAAPQCKSCSVCADKGKSGCASWCNRWTGFLDACKECSASSSERELESIQEINQINNDLNM